LAPNPDRLSDLRADYREMAPMMFDDPAPGFDEIMKRIVSLERLINHHYSCKLQSFAARG
jgi:hypothetical protein